MIFGAFTSFPTPSRCSGWVLIYLAIYLIHPNGDHTTPLCRHSRFIFMLFRLATATVERVEREIYQGT